MQTRSLPLSYLAKALVDESDGVDVAMLSGEVYVLFRLCLLKRDRQALRSHPDTAYRLYRVVMAHYRATSGYVGTVTRALGEDAPTHSPWRRPEARNDAGEMIWPYSLALRCELRERLCSFHTERFAPRCGALVLIMDDAPPTVVNAGTDINSITFGGRVWS